MNTLKEKSLGGLIGKREEEKYKITKIEYQKRFSSLINQIHLQKMFSSKSENNIDNQKSGVK